MALNCSNSRSKHIHRGP